MSSETTICEVCQTKHNSENCYREDLRKQRNRCKIFKIEDDALIATQNLKAGDFILQESPLIWCPAFETNPICLGCGKILKGGNYQACKKCGWSVCSDLCQKAPAHLPECKITVKQKFQQFHPIYGCVPVLRYLYHKQFLPKSAKKLEKFERLWQNKKGTYTCKKREIAEFTRRVFRLYPLLVEDILKIYEIFMMNSYQISTENLNFIGIYNTASLLTHSCDPNCAKFFTKTGEILIKAIRNIQPGEVLTVCYVNPLLGTRTRRKMLQETRFLECFCTRCSDPTEFGTNFSSFKCQAEDCNNGIILPPQSFTEFQSEWVCNKCTKTIPLSLIDEIVERVEQDLERLNRRSLEDCRCFYDNYSSYLYKNNFYFIEIKFLLCQLLGADDLNWKYEICDDLEKLILRLAAGEVQILGDVLVEKCKTCLEIGKPRDELPPLRHLLEKCIYLLADVAEDVCVRLSQEMRKTHEMLL